MTETKMHSFFLRHVVQHWLGFACCASCCRFSCF